MTSERYRILDHAADGKFRAFGESAEEVFSNAALALASLMWEWKTVERRVEHRVEVHGRDLEQLLVRFLEEIIYLLDTRKFLLAMVEDLTIAELPAEGDDRNALLDDPLGTPAESPRFRLNARFVGDDDPEAYEFYGDVKAVTYNEMKIESCPGGPWVIQVVVDM
jgi:SHS2 domain-containing protein